MKYHVTTPPSKHLSARCDSLLFQWDGPIRSLSSMTTSHTSYKPKYLIQQSLISMMFLFAAQRHAMSYQMARTKHTPRILESVALFGNISKGSIAWCSE